MPAVRIDPDWWRTQAFNGEPLVNALARRDIATVFRFLRNHGFSQAAITAHTGIAENRVRTILGGESQVTAYEVLERIAEGLQIPRELMGLGFETPAGGIRQSGRPELSGETQRAAPPRTASTDHASNETPSGGIVESSAVMDGSSHTARRTRVLEDSLGISLSEASSIAAVAGDVIEVELGLDLEINGEGRARLTYHHDLLTLSGPPVTRLAREVWFKHADRDIVIEPVNTDGHRVVIQRIHDTPTMAKFACQISPPLPPGTSASIAYTVEGGLFLTEHYWRQSMPRYVHRYVLRLRHREAGRLRSCIAIEEHPDGSENSAAEQLLWDYDGADIVVTLARDHLRPNQAVTLRWDFDGETARRD